MSQANRHFTREIVTKHDGDKLTVRIVGGDNKVITLSEDTLDYAVTLAPRDAHNLAQALLHAARIAALNIALDEEPANVA